MQGDIVKAAKWLGGSIVAATCVAVVGFHPMVTGRALTVTRVGEGPVPLTATNSQPQALPTAFVPVEAAVVPNGPVRASY